MGSQWALHLIHDEDLLVLRKARDIKKASLLGLEPNARCRVWCRPNSSAIVVVDQKVGGINFKLSIVSVANIVWKEVLHYKPEGMRLIARFFEDSNHKKYAVYRCKPNWIGSPPQRQTVLDVRMIPSSIDEIEIVDGVLIA